jgi:hypothetical protein
MKINKLRSMAESSLLAAKRQNKHFLVSGAIRPGLEAGVAAAAVFRLNSQDPSGTRRQRPDVTRTCDAVRFY